MSEKVKPKCHGEFWETNPSCPPCEFKQDCAEELVLRILEGRSVRPSAIIEMGADE